MPAFQLKARLRVRAREDRLLEGSYSLLWMSANQWREEIRLPGYTRVRVGGPKKYWQARSLPYEFVGVSELDSLLDLGRYARLISDSKLKKVRDMTWDGKELFCVEERFERTGIRRICFDKISGALDLEQAGDLELVGVGMMTRRIYSEYRPWGGKIFPWVVTGLSAEKVIIEFTVESLSSPQNSASGLFQPPADAQEWASCAAQMPEKQVRDLSLKPPVTTGTNRERGTVWVYGVIESDGTLSHVSLAGSAGPNLDKAVLDAVSRSRFKPIVCDGAPARKEVLFGYSY